MKIYLKLLMSGAAVSCMMIPESAVHAQTTDESASEYEITVTGRKREESLNEVPVSISVLDDALIEDTGILTQQDLFDLVPGIQYDEQIDRNSASPSIRGVGSDEIATNRTKVTQFIDGMPVLGSQGNIQFGSVDQVEVFRGPQSAAFGRSTFGGAINYVTKDPGDEFEAEATADFSDYGTRRLGVSLGGPVPLGDLGDTLGYRFDYQWEDSTSPDEFIATDGSHWGERASDAYSGKLVWEPTDALTAELTYSYVESEDEASVNYFIGRDAFNACWDGVSVDDMGVGAYADGQPNCDWSQGAQIRSQIDRVPAIQALLDGGTQYPGITDQQAEDLLYLAAAESITPAQNGAFDERERIALQVDYAFDNGGLAQFSAFSGTEEYIRIQDTNQDTRPLTLALPNNMNGFYSVITGGPLATVGGFMSDPSEIEETYLEGRYVSPGEDRLRYVLGASYYDYSFETTLYFGGYNAVLDGTTDRYDALVGNFYNDGDYLTDAAGNILMDGGNPLDYVYANAAFGVVDPGASIATPNQLFAEEATNIGIYGNVSYDFTEQLTGTFEARFQRDDVGGVNAVTGDGGELTTEAFLPRISMNYNLDSGTTLYAQYSRGNNPAGVNVGFFDETTERQLDCIDSNGDPIDGVTAPGVVTPGSDAATQLGVNGETICGQNYVSYDSDTFKFFEEETIDNFEIGAKGQLFDGDLTFATAVFFMDWKNQGRTVNLDWSGLTMGMADFAGNRTLVNEGDIIMKGVEFEGTYRLTDDLNIRGQFSYLDAEYDTYCDVGILGGGYTEEAALTIGYLDSGTGYECVQVAGKQVVQQAPWTGSISPSYRKELDYGLRFNARADIRYEGAQFIDTINQFETKPVTTVNVSSGLSGDRWGLTLYVNNLFDEDQPLRYGSGDDYSYDPNNAASFSNYYIVPRRQRTIGLRASVNY